MNKLIRWYNQNRRKFWTVIIAVVAGYLLIRTVNYGIKMQNEADKNNIKASNVNKTMIVPNKSAISDYEVNQDVYKSQNEIVSKFVDFCNDKDINGAYDLLSNECKEELYPTVQDFKKYYYDNIFNTKRTYSMQNWTESIYMVRYTEDIMSTGKVTDMSSIQDYIKIVMDGKNKKLNIGGFLGKTDLNKEGEYRKIRVKVISKRVYMDYEIYDLEVENNIGETIMLDTLADNKSMYLIDKNKTKHYAINNEIVRESLIVKDKFRNKIEIKFDNPYIKDRKISSINFSNVAIGNGVGDDITISINL